MNPVEGLKKLDQALGRAVEQVGRDLWPTWQAGLQDLQNDVLRMTLDEAPGASVGGQPGSPTSRESYETTHPEAAPDWREANEAAVRHPEVDSGYEQWLNDRSQYDRSQERHPEMEM